MRNLKHTGRVKHTGKKCLVAYRTLPGDAYNCLIVPTENLPDSYHDAIINLVESNSAQSADEFYEVLARSQFPDGSVMLAALHTQDRLIKASTDQIEMTPNNVTTILLSELNQIIADQKGISVQDLAVKSQTAQGMANAASNNIIPDEVAVPNETVLTDQDLANQYRAEAEQFKREAARLMEEANKLDPVVERKVFTVDVGDMPIEQVIEQVTTTMESKVSIDVNSLVDSQPVAPKSVPNKAVKTANKTTKVTTQNKAKSAVTAG